MKKKLISATMALFFIGVPIRRIHGFPSSGESPEKTIAAVSPDIYTALAGLYENGPDSKIVVTRVGDRLYAQVAGQSEVEIFPKSENEYFSKLDNAIFVFLKDDEGRPAGLHWRGRGTEKTAKRASEPVAGAVNPLLYFDYVGQYLLTPEFSITVTRKNGRLFGQGTGQPRFELFPEGKDAFFLKAIKARIRFQRGEDGGVSKIVVLSARGEEIGKRIKSPKSAAGMVIPFELKGHYILVQCRINDSQNAYTFVVDTGALTFIDKKLADAFQLKQKGPMAKINRLQIGSQAFENVFVFTNFDFQMLKAASGTVLHGIIGSSFLEDYVLTIDYEKRRLILSQDAEPPVGEKENINQGHVLSFTSHPINHSPIIKCKLNGMIDCEAMIDTGQPYPLVLPLAFLEKTGALSRGETLKAMGVMIKWPMTKSLDNWLSRIDGLEAGSLKTGGLTTLYAELPAMLSVALLGKDFLSRFLVRVNYPRHEILLQPRPGDRSMDNMFSAGLSPAEESEDKIVVKGIWENSPAFQAGIEVGDRILEYDSKKLTSAAFPEFWLLLQDDRVGQIKLLIQKGENQKTIVLIKRNLFHGKG